MASGENRAPSQSLLPVRLARLPRHPARRLALLEKAGLVDHEEAPLTPFKFHGCIVALLAGNVFDEIKVTRWAAAIFGRATTFTSQEAGILRARFGSAAYVPPDAGFATKPKLATRMIWWKWSNVPRQRRRNLWSHPLDRTQGVGHGRVLVRRDVRRRISSICEAQVSAYQCRNDIRSLAALHSARYFVSAEALPKRELLEAVLL